MRAFDTFESLAWNMLTSPEARQVFDISQEDAKTRDRYGRNRWGQQCLLARRHVEAGVDLVTTQFSGPLGGRVGNWDDHAVNHNVFEGMQHRCRFYDQAVAALIEDIYDRGLDRRVMVVVTGEFGRTPQINYQASGDFLATIYRHLGVDAEHIAFRNFAGRPIPILPEGGTPIPELLSRL